MANEIDTSMMIRGLTAKRDELLAQAAALNGAIESLRQAFGETPVTLASLLPTPPMKPSPEFHLAPKEPRSPKNPKLRKNPNYGSFSGRDTIAPPPPAKPDHGPLPRGASSDWVSMIASAASPYALALAVMRDHEGTISSAELNAAIAALRDIKGGAGYTVLEPLQKAGIIEGSDNQWTIKDRSKGGIIAGKYLWSETKNLNIYDFAAMRREAVLILLSENSSLTNAAITKSLLQSSWLKAPVTPHLVKADLRNLEKKRVVAQNFEDKTWRLIAK